MLCRSPSSGTGPSSARASGERRTWSRSGSSWGPRPSFVPVTWGRPVGPRGSGSLGDWGQVWGQVAVTLFREVRVVTGQVPMASGHDCFVPRWPFCAVGWVLTRCPLACVAEGVGTSGCVLGALGYRGRRGGPGPFPLEPSAWACAPALGHLECLGRGATSGLWHPRAAGDAAEVLYHRALPAAGTEGGL